MINVCINQLNQSQVAGAVIKICNNKTGNNKDIDDAARALKTARAEACNS